MNRLLPVLLALSSVSQAQTTWYVDAAGAPPGSGTQLDPYTRIQYAIEQPTTLAGDTVSVAAGTYLDEALDFLGKDLVVASQSGASVTTVVAPAPQGMQTVPAVRFASGETSLAVLRGFTLTGGSGEPVATAWGPGAGGGIYCEGASPRVVECVVTGNSARIGGGVFVRSAAMELEDCSIQGNGGATTLIGGGLFVRTGNVTLVRVTLEGNVAAWDGGGAYSLASDVLLSRSSVIDNETLQNSGGGLYASGGTLTVEATLVRGNESSYPGGGIALFQAASAVIADSRIEDNKAKNNDGEQPGGGIYIDGASLDMSRTVVSGNRGQFGGGLHALGDVTIRECAILDNRSNAFSDYSSAGGGLHVAGGNVVVEETVFAGNRSEELDSWGGGAVFGPATLRRCTLVGNFTHPSGGGAYGATLIDCIVRGNVPDQLASSTATFSDIEGGWPGAGNIDADPRFWSEAERDFHLLPGSPCIDAGDPSSPLDADSSRADMGAFPFDPTHCGPGCTGPIGTSYCSATTNSSGSAALLTALGNTSLAENLVLLRARQLPPGEFGYFLMSETQAFVPMLGGGQGNLCLGLPIVRFNEFPLSSSLVGEVNFQVLLDQLPQGVVFQIGENWNFQYWFRDVNPQSTSNTSDGLSITWQ